MLCNYLAKTYARWRYLIPQKHHTKSLHKDGCGGSMCNCVPGKSGPVGYLKKDDLSLKTFFAQKCFQSAAAKYRIPLLPALRHCLETLFFRTLIMKEE